MSTYEDNVQHPLHYRSHFDQSYWREQSVQWILGFDPPAVLTRTRWVWSQPGSHGSPPPPAESQRRHRCCGSVRPISVPGAQAIAREPPTPACHQIKWISNWVEAPTPARPGWGDSLHFSIPLLVVICFSFFLSFFTVLLSLAVSFLIYLTLPHFGLSDGLAWPPPFGD